MEVPSPPPRAEARRARAQAASVSAFLANGRLAALVRAGRLQLRLWDHLGRCAGPAHAQCWRLLVYSHAVLDAWDARAFLLFMDVDEFFVLPKRGASLAGALQRCAGDRSLARPARAPPRGAPVSSCSGCPGPVMMHAAYLTIKCWMWGRRAHAAGGAQVLVERYDAFLNPRVRAMLPKGASEVEALWRAVGFRKHPLSQYSVQSPNATRASKVMVRPGRAGAAEVRGGARREPCSMSTLPGRCPSLLEAYAVTRGVPGCCRDGQRGAVEVGLGPVPRHSRSCTRARRKRGPQSSCARRCRCMRGRRTRAAPTGPRRSGGRRASPWSKSAGISFTWPTSLRPVYILRTTLQRWSPRGTGFLRQLSSHSRERAGYPAAMRLPPRWPRLFAPACTTLECMRAGQCGINDVRPALRQ